MRRGQVADMLVVFFFIVFFCFFLLSMYLVWNETNAAFQAADAIPADTKSFFQEQTTHYNSGADYIFLSVFIAFTIGVLILSYFLNSVPLLFWAFWIVIMTFGIAAGYIANAYDTVANILSTASSNFPIMSFIMNNYLHFTIALGLLMVLVYNAKGNTGSATL